ELLWGRHEGRRIPETKVGGKREAASAAGTVMSDQGLGMGKQTPNAQRRMEKSRDPPSNLRRGRRVMGDRGFGRMFEGRGFRFDV
ncbi:MAG TPA: hypothetical protein VGM65_12690, partial [Candidatus Udaeobacter sp.]